MGGVDPMKNIAKGRGDSWLFDPKDLILIGLDYGDSKHPLYDKRVLNPPNEAMVVSLDKDGQIQPITFRVEEINGEWRPVVVDGRQRVINAREVNRRREATGEKPLLVKAIKSEVAKNNDHKAIGLLVSANAVRTAFTEIEEADLARKMMAEYGYEEEEVAQKFGVSVATLRRRMSVAEATDEVRTAYIAGEVPMGAAVELAKLQPAQQRETLAKMREEGKTTSDKKHTGANEAAKGAAKAAGVGGKDREHMRSIKQVRALTEYLDGKVPSAKDRPLYEAIRTVLGWTQGNPDLDIKLLLEGMGLELPKASADSKKK